MDPREERRQLLARVRATADRAKAQGRDFTDPERRQVSEDLDRVEDINRNLKKAAESKRFADDMSVLLAAENGQKIDQSALDGTHSTGRGMKAAIEQFARTAADAMTGRAGSGQKAVINPQGSFTAATPWVTGTTEAVIGPDPRNGVLGLVTFDEKTFVEGHQFAYLREKTRIGRAAVVPDRAQKPQSDYELEEVQDNLKVLAHLAAPIPVRYLEDYSSLKTYLETVLARDLFRLLAEEIISGDGSESHLTGILQTSGVQQTAFTGSLPATLRKARTVLADVDEQPTAWLVNPADAEALDLFTDDQGRFQSLRDILGNLPVVPSPALPTGQAILADWRQAVVVTKAEDGVRLSAHDGLPYRDPVTGSTDGTNLFERNLVQIRAEIRVGGLAMTRPKAFTVVDLLAA